MQADQMLDRIMTMICEGGATVNEIRGAIEEYGDLRYRQGQDAEYLNIMEW